MIIIEPAHLGHLPTIAHLEKQLYLEPWSQKSFEELLGEEAFWFWVAKESEEIVGYLVCQVVGSEAELHNIAVAREYQRRGIGKRLLIKLVEALRQKKVTELYLMVRASNNLAKNLYERFGFEKMGVRKKYYHSPDEDALVYRFNPLFHQ